MKFLHESRLTLATLALLALLAPLSAQADEGHHPAAAATAAAASDMTAGEIRKIDLDTARITLKHGDIKNLDMPPMTMVFQVKDGALLDALKAGDKIRFVAEKTATGYAVTEIRPAP